MPVDHDRIRRESNRWNCLLTLKNAQPLGVWEELILDTLRAITPDITKKEVREIMDYLQEQGYVRLKKKPHGRWHGKLTANGLHLLDYDIDCPPGISRPEKYW
uniref:Uncharacterized protein n=1 Tax=Candidatus Kentrum sp. UNK TaxID=2126344 RepID=A0A451B445_9GAMM|nr:MAG: hypothetical protein BECKUNK1418G_GA0071005_115912 [Candidatus Kentron sp. UNK]VFK73052.1 MAG: hypothetical protein BECKUNK1418H_GA0071006_115912 [Candidatus Kentron sp. UNK]